MNIQPIADHIFVRRAEGATNTPSGLVIPIAAQEERHYGTVVAVGPGRRNPKTGNREPMAVALGDNILFGKYTGVEVMQNGEELVSLRESEVLGIIEGD